SEPPRSRGAETPLWRSRGKGLRARMHALLQAHADEAHSARGPRSLHAAADFRRGLSAFGNDHGRTDAKRTSEDFGGRRTLFHAGSDAHHAALARQPKRLS